MSVVILVFATWKPTDIESQVWHMSMYFDNFAEHHSNQNQKICLDVFK